MARNDNVFDAGQYGQLRYDFKAFGGVQGMTPDPSDEMLEAFMRGMRDAAKQYSAAEGVDVDNLTQAEIAELMEDDDAMQIVAAQKTICSLVGDLTGGSPSADQLLALPLRVRQAYIKWIQGKLFDPEAGAASSTNAPVRRIGG